MTINDRISDFIGYLGISTRKFYKANGLSDGALNSKEMGAEKVSRIIEKYRESHGLNIEWLLFGRGDMILDPLQLAETPEEYERVVTIDKIVEKKIDQRFDDIKETLAELVANEIEKEIEKVKKETKG